MTLGDIKEYIAADDAALGKKAMSWSCGTKRTSSLSRLATGLKAAHPKEYHRWFPTWATVDRVLVKAQNIL